MSFKNRFFGEISTDRLKNRINLRTKYNKFEKVEEASGIIEDLDKGVRQIKEQSSWGYKEDGLRQCGKYPANPP